MKTRIKNLLLLLLLLGLPGVVQAQDAYSTNADGSIYTYGTNADGSANIADYAGPPWVVTIPTNINGLTVTTIGENAFLDDSLISVTIPNSVTSIGDYAFYICSSLTSVTIPNSVTNIGVGAFQECTSLTNITIPNSVTSIGDEAFTYCTSLKSVTIGNSVTSIGDNAFADCFSLTSVTIPNSVTGIGDYAFESSGLKSVTIPNTVTSIGESAFFMCSSLTSVTIGNSVTNIGDGAFFECYSLTSVTIPNSLTSIGYYAFANTILTSVTIPNSVTSIGEEAFAFCSGLTSVTIPNSVTSIGDFAFEYCTSLTGVYFQGNSPSPSNDSSVFNGDPATVYYLPGTTGWGATFDGLPTAPWFLPNPVILNFEPGFGIQPGGFGFTISWATNASVIVQAATNLANPVWIPVSTSPLTSGTNYFSDPQWTNYPARFYRAASAFTVGGTLTGLPAGDTVTLQDNGGDNLTLSANGTFTFPTALPNGHAYSITVSGIYFGGLTPTTCTFTNGSGTISGANVTNVAAQCAWTGTRPPPLTGNPAVDMFNAAVADGTANGGVPAVMYTENGGPFRVTAPGVFSYDVALRYYPWSSLAVTVGNTSCSSTTFPSGTPVIQFGTALAASAQTYTYTYTGNDFTSISNAANESSYGFVPYTTSDKVTGSITFSAPLGDNYEGNPSATLMNFNFTDGVGPQNIGGSQAVFPYVMDFTFATDSSGDIVSWNFQTTAFIPPNAATLTKTIQTETDSGGVMDSGNLDYEGTIVGEGSVTSDPGVWVETITPAPEPSVALLFVSSAALVLGFRGFSVLNRKLTFMKTHIKNLFIALSLASFLFIFGTAVKSNAAAWLTNSPPANGQCVISWNSRGTLEMAAQLSGPWITVSNATNPYTNQIMTGAQFFRLNQTVDATTLHKKVLCGYQGWFRCPGDGLSSWFHWSSSQSQITTNTLTFEMWPDMSEYSNKYAAPTFTYPGGAQAYLFSPQNQQTVDKHFDWMVDYGIDGVVVQRFVSDIAGRPWMTNVLNHVREAANRTGRTFCLEYDMSGANTTTLFSQMTNDWMMLVNAQHVTQDPRYLFHNGKPVLFIFGFFTNSFANAALPQQIIDWFKTNSIQSVTLIGSGEWWWNTETDPSWTNLFRSFDGYEPWNTGNYTTVGANKYATTGYWATDLQAATDAGMIYLPEIYPGFSWDNLQKLAPGTSKIDRLGGDFLWQQFYAVKNLGLDWAFVGMFDEVDEGTAIFKVSNTPPMQGYFVTYDGYPTDWYMRLTAEGSKILAGESPNTPNIPISP